MLCIVLCRIACICSMHASAAFAVMINDNNGWQRNSAWGNNVNVAGTRWYYRCSSCLCGCGWWTSSSGSVRWRSLERLLRTTGRLTRKKTCLGFLWQVLSVDLWGWSSAVHVKFCKMQIAVAWNQSAAVKLHNEKNAFIGLC